MPGLTTCSQYLDNLPVSVSFPSFLIALYCHHHHVLCLVTKLCLTLWDPKNCSPPGSSIHGDYPGKSTGVGWNALLQGIVSTQGSSQTICSIAYNPGRFFTTMYHIILLLISACSPPTKLLKEENYGTIWVSVLKMSIVHGLQQAPNEWMDKAKTEKRGRGWYRKFVCHQLLRPH